MHVKSLKVRNFKSFGNLNVCLGNLNVLIGANASGKSNFIQIFRFLKDIKTLGLDNAISIQGGSDYLRNMNINKTEPLSIHIVLENKTHLGIIRRIREQFIGIRPYETIYEFEINFRKRKNGFEIVKDVVTHKCHFDELKIHLSKKKKAGTTEKIKAIGQGEIKLSHVDKKIKVTVEKNFESPIEERDIYPAFPEEEFPRNTLLLETSLIHLPPYQDIFTDIAIYDFDPKLPKKAASLAGKAELEEDGSNLSIALKKLIENQESKRKLFNLIIELLPFISKLDVETFTDKSLLFKLQEKYFKKQYIPASLISDGTINITALIIALYFEKKYLTIIEEPERNIHPYLIAKIMTMMKEASQNKQIILTTHNPEIIKNTDLENILLVSRNEENGHSIISKPANSKQVNIFLKNEIGLEELYIQNLL